MVGRALLVGMLLAANALADDRVRGSVEVNAGLGWLLEGHQSSGRTGMASIGLSGGLRPSSRISVSCRVTANFVSRSGFMGTIGPEVELWLNDYTAIAAALGHSWSLPLGESAYRASDFSFGGRVSVAPAGGSGVNFSAEALSLTRDYDDRTALATLTFMVGYDWF